MTNGLGPVVNFCVWVKELINFVFVLGLLASLIDLKADLEGPSRLRDLFLDRSKLLIPNPNTKVTYWSRSVCHI
jgi:hypothetical protein